MLKLPVSLLLAALLPAVYGGKPADPKPAAVACSTLATTDAAASVPKIDGIIDPKEWDGATAFPLYRASKETSPMIGEAKFITNCYTSEWYIMVSLAGKGEYIEWVKDDEHFVKINGVVMTNAGMNFHFVKKDGIIVGWEAKFIPKDVQEPYYLKVHTLIYESKELQTAGTPDDKVEVCLDCDGIEPVLPAEPEPEPADEPEPEPEPGPLADPLPPPPQCGNDADCQPDLPDQCQLYSCNSGTCVAHPVENGAPCGKQDGLGPCEIADSCQSGVCTPGGFMEVGTPCNDQSESQCDHPDTCSADGQCLPNKEVRSGQRVSRLVCDPNTN